MAADPLADSAGPGFDDPLGMLAACHRRIERQLATLDRLQRHLPEHGCDSDARAAARAILKYFDSAAPNHHADEEMSLFPRLVAAASKQASPLIAELEGEHVRLAAGWRHLRPQLAGIVAGARGNLSPKEVEQIRAAYAAHIAREEDLLIPLAARTLDAGTLAMIGREMAERRGVDPSAAPRGLR
jgi:pyridoxamine 5'-phosphate oxidase